MCEGGGCTPTCSGKQCGPDGCGGTCGSCGFGEFCNIDGQCISGACTPACAGKQCGPDGCGGTCGTCNPGFVCVEDICKQQCAPTCQNKECGADGCGGSCGACGFGQVCTVAGLCKAEDEVTPDEVAHQDGADDGDGGGGTALKDPDEDGDDEGDGADPFAAGGSSSTPGESGECNEGLKLMYGKCVPDNSFEAEESYESGCSAAPGSRGAGVLLLVLMALLAFARRQRRTD